MAHDQDHAAEYNPVDPHGQHERIHHHVYSWQFLTAVLLILLFFTFLTVVVSQGEKWLVDNIAITIPDVVNALIAMFIATIKASLVVMYFMGLRRGNPMNTMIFLFTLFAFAMFLGFTALDLGNRKHAYDYRGQSVIPGGTGAGIELPGTGGSFTGPIVTHAREQEIARLMEEEGKTEAQAWAYWEKKYHAGDHGGDHHGGHSSTANHHVRRTGLTPGLFSTTEPEHADAHYGDKPHADDHGEADHGDHSGDHDDANPQHNDGEHEGGDHSGEEQPGEPNDPAQQPSPAEQP